MKLAGRTGGTSGHPYKGVSLSVPSGVRYRLRDIFAMSRSCPAMSRCPFDPRFSVTKPNAAKALQCLGCPLEPLLERVPLGVPPVNLAPVTLGTRRLNPAYIRIGELAPLRRGFSSCRPAPPEARTARSRPSGWGNTLYQAWNPCGTQPAFPGFHF